MRVTVVRGGGFAGLPARVLSVDTGDLAPPMADELLARVAAVRAAVDGPAPAARGSADAYSYEITVQDGSGSSTVRRQESQLTPQLRVLVSWVSAQVRAAP